MSQIALLNFLEVISELDCQPESEALLNQMTALVNECGFKPVGDDFDKIQSTFQQIKADIHRFEQNLEDIKANIYRQIQAYDEQNLPRSLADWEGGEKHELSFSVLNRKRVVDPLTSIMLHERLKIKTNWQYPAMVLRPAKALHVESLVSSDPLYFLDTDQDLMDATANWFTPDYQRRLCKYIYKESLNEHMFDNLPINQMSLVYACDFLNFRPFELIKKYMAQVLGLLRPGGYFVLTYNNCDTISGAQLFEINSGSYVPGRLLKQSAKTLGYEIAFEYSDNNAFSWIELKKPGELSSIRAGQTLASIKNKPIEEYQHQDYIRPEPDRGPPLDIDPHDDPKYNEVNTLLDICEFLNIDKSLTVSKGQPSVKKMRKLISEHLRSKNFPTEKITRLLEKRKPK